MVQHLHLPPSERGDIGGKVCFRKERNFDRFCWPSLATNVQPGLTKY